MRKFSLFNIHLDIQTLYFSVLLSLTIVLAFSMVRELRARVYFQSLSATTADRLVKTTTDYQNLKKVDQFVRNEELTKKIKDIEDLYSKGAKTYEEIQKIGELGGKTAPFSKDYAQVITYLSEKNTASASVLLAKLNKDITTEKLKLESDNAPRIPENVQTNNAPPGSDYSRQYVKTDYGTYMVDIIAADLGSNRVVVDTASDGTCKTDCPVMSLGDYAGRSGAWAGINGPYFCPDSYPSCSDSKNAFDTLLMNKNKVYFNSDNNVYSTVPAAIFSSSPRFVSRSLDWGRDTGVDSVIASQPLLLSGGNITFGGDSEIKRAGKGARSFIGSKGSVAYIGIVYNANVAEVAVVLKSLGLENALNLDSGGSTALWSSGRYVAGPGRNTPFGILFVRR